MKFQYTKQIDPDRLNVPMRKVPLVEMGISKNGQSLGSVFGLLDSGADYCLFNSQYASALDIDLSSCLKIGFTGIEGFQKIPAHMAEIEIETKYLNKITITVGFIDSPSVDILLGQIGYFDNYRIKFERDHNVFEITPVKR